MNLPYIHIRTEIFGISQAAMGQIVGCSRIAIWQKEHGEHDYTSKQQRLIRSEATRRGISWRDSYFFEVPAKRRTNGRK